MSRWTRDESIAGGAVVLLIIALFLPWYTVSAFGFTISENAFFTHGWMWVDFIVCLAILAFLAVRAGYDQMPFDLPVTPAQALLALTGLNLLLVLIAFFAKPFGSALIPTGWGTGAYLGLLCALAAAAAAGHATRPQEQ